MGHMWQGQGLLEMSSKRTLWNTDRLKSLCSTQCSALCSNKAPKYALSTSPSTGGRGTLWRQTCPGLRHSANLQTLIRPLAFSTSVRPAKRQQPFTMWSSELKQLIQRSLQEGTHLRSNGLSSKSLLLHLTLWPPLCFLLSLKGLQTIWNNCDTTSSLSRYDSTEKAMKCLQSSKTSASHCPSREKEKNKLLRKRSNELTLPPPCPPPAPPSQAPACVRF